MKQKISWLVVFLAILMGINPTQVFGQSDLKLIREGNKNYKSENYSDAEIAYRKSLEKNRKSFEGEFNLGDALYRQGKYGEAADKFRNLASQHPDHKNVAGAYHNLGNALLKDKKYEESVDAYKRALRNNPGDDETRYNLAYAMSQLKQQQQQQDNKDGKDNKEQDKKDQQKQGQDKKEDKQDGEKQEQSKEQKQGDEKKEGEAARKPEQKISKEDAERILQALNNQEKDAQKKLSRKEAVRISIEKDW